MSLQQAKSTAEMIAGMDKFTKHYLIAALWADAPDEQHFDLNEIHPVSIAHAILDCVKFQRENAALLANAYTDYAAQGLHYHPDAGSVEACAGHDFWLTRQHHGTGFWDRGLALGQALTTASQVFPELSVTAEDGVVFIE